MNTTDYVTIDTAKLLKSAGYPQEYKLSLGGALISTDGGAICRPSLWDAMKWLREEKKLFLEITLWSDMFGIGLFRPDYPTDNIFPWTVSSTRYPTYEDADDAGIAAACKWLIANDTNDESKTE